MIGVLLADDQALVREGFRLIIEVEPDIEVVGEAGDGVETVEQAKRLQPDVILMDIRMPGLDGIAATRRLAQAGVAARVLVLTTFDRDDYLYEAMKAGASGFLLKDARRDQLVTMCIVPQEIEIADTRRHCVRLRTARRSHLDALVKPVIILQR